MAVDKTPGAERSESAKQTVIEQLWLTYYNDTLYAKGLITEDQRNRMRLMIKRRTEAKIRKHSLAGNCIGNCQPSFYVK